MKSETQDSTGFRLPRCGVTVVPVDLDPCQAAEKLIEVGSSVSNRDGKIRGLMFVPRDAVPGAQRGRGLSRIIAALRELPGPGEGPYEKLVDHEELVAIIVPDARVRELAEAGEQLVARNEHDEGCPRLRPNADVCSCRCDATLSVVVEEIPPRNASLAL